MRTSAHSPDRGGSGGWNLMLTTESGGRLGMKTLHRSRHEVTGTPANKESKWLQVKPTKVWQMLLFL